jgi:hypothetical protein
MSTVKNTSLTLVYRYPILAFSGKEKRHRIKYRAKKRQLEMEKNKNSRQICRRYIGTKI